jgi:hypothetical protein
VTRERDHLAGLVGFRARRVGVEQVRAFAVVHEEGEHRLGPLRAAGNVVALERDVVTEVHDRVEVQIKIGAAGLPRLDHRASQSGQ